MACGFNGGTIGIPNLKEHAATLGLIRRTIMNYLSLHGRHALEWVDQEAANYVGYKLGTFETARYPTSATALPRTRRSPAP